MFYLLNLSMNLLLRRALMKGAQNSENNQKTQRTQEVSVLYSSYVKKVVISKNLVF